MKIYITRDIWHASDCIYFWSIKPRFLKKEGMWKGCTDHLRFMRVSDFCQIYDFILDLGEIITVNLKDIDLSSFREKTSKS